jgi:hypothetical protein
MVVINKWDIGNANAWTNAWAIATVVEGCDEVLVDTRGGGHLIYVASGEEESCTNDTRI